jgi:XapX domain-containing protein
MKVYLISLVVGLVIGVIYGLLNVKSPAPPLVALAGLLGILLGEQAVPLAKHLIAGHPPAVAWQKTGNGAKVFGRLGDESAEPKDGV